MNQNEVVTVITSTQVSIHLRNIKEPEIAHTRFCGNSFEAVARTFMGDVHPKAVELIIFDKIDPPLPDGQAMIIVDCNPLEPIFAFGHELVHD